MISLFTPYNPATSPVGYTSIPSSATPSYNVGTSNFVDITALATNITSMTSGISGTPVNGQSLRFRIKDNGTARTITWGAAFENGGDALILTTTVGKYSILDFVYNSATSTWQCISSTTSYTMQADIFFNDTTSSIDFIIA